MIKSFKIRIYPTKEQEQKLWRHIGSCRFVWNYMLSIQEENYKNGGKYLSAFNMINLLKPLKNDGEHEWLYDVSNASLQVTCQDLHKAYDAFFKKARKHPRFKSRKRDRPSYPLRTDTMYIKDESFVSITKIGKIKYKTDFRFLTGKGSCKFSNPRISYIPARNIWMLSFGMECESQAPVLTDTPMGIDLGVKDLAIVAFGDEQIVFPNINKTDTVRKLERHKKYLQRGISRKYEASKKRTGRYEKTNNIIKEEQKLRKVDYRLANIRNNYIHQSTHKLITMLPSRITMEDLNVSGMMKNRHLSKAIAQQGLAEFVRQMEYKCEWNGIPFIKADRFYPSSKTCSCCGTIKKDLKLKDRTYICPECGLTIDRDYNAAINLMKYVA